MPAGQPVSRSAADADVERVAARVEELQQRVDDVVAQLDEARQHNLRLAEIVDVVQELLVPLAHRDEARLAEAIESFTRTV